MAGLKWIYFFGAGASEGDPQRVDILGGKGASLAAMSRAGLAVPPGFTISVECCRHYHEQGGKWPEGLEEELRQNLAKLEATTGRKFGTGSRPLLVSVRSGAAVSMPGMMDTLLNCGLHPALAAQLPHADRFWLAYHQFVRQFSRTVANIEDATEDAVAISCDPKAPASNNGFDHRALSLAAAKHYQVVTGRPFPDTAWQVLVECVNAVFESWNSPRALVYRKAQDVRGVQGTAVTVQSMFPSEVSGIAFTANPGDPLAGEIIIESSYGLGEAVVSGMVSPDLFVLDRQSLAIKSKRLGNKVHAVAALEEPSGLSPSDPAVLSLTDEQLLELARLSIRVEEYFGFPVDMEWGLSGGKFAMLQARKIKGLEVARDIEAGRQEEIARLRGLAKHKRKIWVVHNLSETLTAPTPLTWDIIRRFMSYDGGFGHLYRDMGYHASPAVRKEGFLELICGRIYSDPDRAAQLFWGDTPLEYDFDAVVEDPTLMETAPGKFNPKRADGAFLLRLGPMVYAMMRAARRTKRAQADALRRFEQEILPPYLHYIRQKQSEDLAALDTPQVIAELRDRIEKVLTQFGAESLKPGYFGGMARGRLEAVLTQLMGSHLARQRCGELTSGLEGDSTVEQNIMLYRVARGQGTLPEFLKAYGHRTVGEMELAEPRWHEDSEYLQKMVQRFAGPTTRAPEELHTANARRREEIERKLTDELAQWGGSFQEPEIRELIAEAQKLLPQREVGKHYLMMGYDLIRRAIMELSRRWNLGRDVFFLTLDELPVYESQSAALRERITQRKMRWQSAQRLLLADVVDSNDLESLGKPAEIESAEHLDALPLAPGLAEGEARIIFSPAEGDQLPDRCILVCPSTDPGWTALFVNLGGLIVDRGGVLSHGAITARDFGIPAVACHQATRRLAGVKRIRIDGGQGRITVLE